MATPMTATDSMLKAVDAAREQVTDSASKIGSVAMKEAGKIRSAVADGAADVADSAVAAAKDRASDWQQLLTKEISERPLRTLGVAAAIGFLFGWTRG
jgi:ElaB/YqjD/DUF883 family membrane-anchored ribosome-binding protein